MARYFFAVRFRDRLLPDNEGVDLEDGVDLGRCALHLAARLRRDASIPQVQFRSCRIEVSDENGQITLEVPVPTL